MNKEQYNNTIECYRNHKKDIEDLDNKGLYIMKPCDVCGDRPCGLGGFEKVDTIPNNYWTAEEVRAYHEDKIASIFYDLQRGGWLGCDRDRFCDDCPIEEDCIDEKIFKKDAVEGVHYIKADPKIMTKQEYNDKMREIVIEIVRCQEDLANVDSRTLYLKDNTEDCMFFANKKIERLHWTASEVESELTHHIAALYRKFESMKTEMFPCRRDDFCDECVIADSCGDENKVFEKDAIEGVHYIKGKEVPKQ